MEIFEKETVFDWLKIKGDLNSSDIEYVSGGRFKKHNVIKLRLTWCDGQEIIKMWSHYKYESYIEFLIDKFIIILSHPCPKEIRPKIIAMLNSGDIDSIKLAEGILKNL